MDYGILITDRTSTKAARFLSALSAQGKNIGIDCRVIRKYEPCKTLILYGLGGDDRLPVAMAHRKKGGNFIAWDLPYWNRNGRTFRLALNGNHPGKDFLAFSAGPERFNSANLLTGNISNPDGPVLLIGNAPKSIKVWAKGWTQKTSERLQALGREVIYRPKPGRPAEHGVKYQRLSDGPIDEALRDVSLVVCLHSNVAVDACRMGAPVACDAGAASLIYPTLDNYHSQPPEAVRMDFLHKLAWWQWADTETRQAWGFIKNTLCV